MSRQTPRPHSRITGFTLIEILIVVLILAILMAVAMPLYLAAVTDADRKTCRTNLQTLANAEVAYKLRSSAHTFTIDLNALIPDLGSVPVCPVHGTYSAQISTGTLRAYNGQLVPPGGLLLRCRGVRHGRFAPGIDSE